jgi:hypothetical protein
MNKPITAECYRNHDAQDYLAVCEHPEHELRHCFISGCMGFIVAWETWQPGPNPICARCQDSGYSIGANGELIQP